MGTRRRARASDSSCSTRTSPEINSRSTDRTAATARLMSGTARENDELPAPRALRGENVEPGGSQLARNRRSRHAVVLFLRPSFRIGTLFSVRREIDHRQPSTRLQRGEQAGVHGGGIAEVVID